MRRFRLAALAAAAAIVFGSTSIASAADLPVKAPPIVAAPPHFSWTGFYIGANIGGGWASNSVSYTPNDPGAAALFSNGPTAVPPSASISSSGAIGGLQLGYNWQMKPDWLFGVEADFDWFGGKGSSTTGGINGIVAYTNAVEERVKWLGTVRGRLGYLPAPNLLAFVTGGFAYGQLQRTGTYTTNGPLFAGAGGFTYICAANVACFNGSTSTTSTGWTLGGGLEYGFSQNWTLRGEYLYVSLASGNSVTETAANALGGTLPAAFNANFGRANLNIARAALNYRF
jgi:outer membrane immunogenic protein